MKTTNILYWVFTIPFAGFMMFSAVPDILMQAEAVDFITKLGYPPYIIPFLGVAKALGCIAIVVPGFARLKEWAYAGLFYDLLGATYSAISQFGVDPAMSFMLVIFAFLALSYIYHHKRLRQKQHQVIQAVG